MDPESFSLFNLSVDLQTLLEFLILFGLLACSAFVSGAEVALFSLSQTDLEEAKQINPDKGKLIDEMIQKPKKFIGNYIDNQQFHQYRHCFVIL